MIRHERVLERGLVMKGMPSDPPKIVVAPWNTLTLVKNLSILPSSPVTITKTNVLDYLRVQLGLPVTVQNNFARIRFVKVRAWLDQGAISTPMALLMEPFAIIGEDFAEKIEDWSGDVQYAKCGFVWPRAQQEAVFSARGGADDTIVRFSISGGDVAKQLIMYLEILWASNVTSVELFNTQFPETSDIELGSISNLSLTS